MPHQEADIAANPVDRKHQDRIALFQQELYVISDTLNQQRRMLMLASPSTNYRNNTPYARPNLVGLPYDDDFSRSKTVDVRRMYPQPAPRGATDIHEPFHQRYDPHNVEAYDVPIVLANPALSPTSQLAPTHPNGVLGILIYDSLSLVDHKLRDVKEMNDWVSHLQASNLQKIDTNKDRQEAAIYAFTIVTIVFLPLSTVAGILGMNTVDIRDMEASQWLFWASAVPITVLVITLCLVWAGELRNFWEGFRDLWRRGTGPRKGMGVGVDVGVGVGVGVGSGPARFASASAYGGMDGMRDRVYSAGRPQTVMLDRGGRYNRRMGTMGMYG